MTTTLEKLKSKAKKLPKSCGVYLMKNTDGKVIYVGKAKNLKNRVCSYFVGVSSHDIKTRKLVENIEDFEIILLDTEVESLLLERSLIKTHYPRYNILLKDGKEYPYIRIDLNHPWPRIRKVRQRKDDGAKYLGPYGTVAYLNTMLRLVHRIFPLVRCSDYEFKNAKRPCNYYHFKQCLGPCVLSVDRDLYKKTIDDALLFLSGKTAAVKEAINSKMLQASQAMEYEIAAQYRDQITALDNFIQKQSVAFENINNADAIGVKITGKKASVHVINVRESIISNRDNFILDVHFEEKNETLLFEFILQYYENRYLPEKILISHAISDRDVLAEAIKTNSHLNTTGKVRIATGHTREEKDLLNISNKNAAYSFEQANEKLKTQKISLEIVKTELAYPGRLNRIECIDISNMGGTAIVASCVCFIDGAPAKNFYRRYNISDESEHGPDDFGSIRYVLKRRLDRAIRENDSPDIILIDGGKGQLSSAIAIKNEYPSLDVTIISIAKSRLENSGSIKHTSPNHTAERIFFPDRQHPVALKVGSPSYRLLTQLRDEAHRFAITHHRKKRSQIRHTSLLEKIEGIGPVLRKRLFDRFHSLETIAGASIESIADIPGITEDKALDIKNFLLNNLEDPSSQ